MASVTVRYWAAARAAAGRAEDELSGRTLDTVLDHATLVHGPALARVLAVSSFLVDGERADRNSAAPLRPSCVVEVLPPFAGG